MIERRGVAYDLRGGALGLRPGAGGEEISGVVTIYHHDSQCCLLLLRAEVRARAGEREHLRGDEGRLQNHLLNSRIELAAKRRYYMMLMYNVVTHHKHYIMLSAAR